MMKETGHTEKPLDFDGVEAGDFAAFCQIVAALRAEDGCPWDRAQTFASLKKCMADEAGEVLAGIDRYYETGDADNFCEELGDVLLNVVLMAEMAQEQGLFSMEDVVRTAGRKMLRRHPHVFGEDARRGWDESDLSGMDALPSGWEEIKALEKKRGAVKISGNSEK